MIIERIGKTTGRWPKYELIVDGVNLGFIRRTISVGRDGLLGRNQSRWDGWAISGLVTETREKAEEELIRRAIRFGRVTEDSTGP